MKIFFKIDTNDDSIYTVNINNQKYIINSDNSSIEITETVDKLSFTIQGKIERLTLKKCFLTLLLSFIKIPLFALFDYISESKWYQNKPIFEFTYKFITKEIDKDITITIKNSYNQDLKGPQISTNCGIDKIQCDFETCSNSLKKGLVNYICDITVVVIILSVIAGLILLANTYVSIVLFTIIILSYLILISSQIAKYRKIIASLKQK